MNSIQSKQNILSPPFEAAKKGDLNIIQDFVNENGWIDMPNDKGNSLLYYAAKNGQINVIYYLLEKGAHFYHNKNGQSVVSIAKDNVKAILQEKKKALKIKFDQCIEKKVRTLSSVEESIKFITSIPPSHIRNTVLDDYFIFLIFAKPEKIFICLDLLPESRLDKIAKMVVFYALCCTDIPLASKVKDHDSIKPENKEFFNFQINEFSKLLNEHEEKMNEHPSCFSELIQYGFNSLNKIYPLDNYLEELITQVSSARSFLKAFALINEIEDDEIRAFARWGLSFCGLEGLALAAENEAEIALGQSEEKWDALFLKLNFDH